MVKQQSISDRVSLARRYVRSTDLVRDFHDDRALAGYVVTASAKEALHRLSDGLRSKSTQRAFRVTGAYGSGKSSFGLLLARLAQGGDATADELALSAGVEWSSAVDPHFPIVMNGRHVSFASELLRTIAKHCDGKGTSALRKRLIEAESSEPGDKARLSLEALNQFAGHILETRGMRTLLLVDEMGRFVEFAAANPRAEDPSIFQQLAERAGGSGGGPVAVVAFLHNRFADYVAGMGDWVEAEWTRSAERYEELPFRNDLEQTLYLLAGALSARPNHVRAVAERARELYEEAGGRGVFSLAGSDLPEMGSRLYPLHPASVSAVAAMARRLGQNDRSVFGFLQALEPHGFRRFAETTAYGPDHWYHLPELFDYLAAQGGIRFNSPDRDRRWHLALDAVAQLSGEEIETNVQKCVALISVLEPLAGIRADADCIAWCLGIPTEAAEEALDRLVERMLLYRRPQSGDHSLWSSSSVDLDHWLDEARIRVPATSRLDGIIAAIPPARPLVAHRHFQRTGTLRSFSTSIRTIDDGKPIRNDGPTDGQIVVAVIHPDDDPETIEPRLAELSSLAGPMVFVHRHNVEPTDLKWAHQLAMWQWVRESCPELRLDDLARAEVHARIAQAQAQLLAALTPMLAVGRGRWWHNGETLQIADRADLSRRLSAACDMVFHAAPILRNELVNRSKLSTAIASARMRLLETMLDASEKPMLGLTGAPPERTIHLAMFHASGMHRALTPGSFAFAPPPIDDPHNWAPAWKRLRELLARPGSVSFSELIDDLAQAPWGVRAGPALLLIAAFMLHGRRDVALMERNSFQPEVTPAHFMRLAKNPSNFALRHVGGDGPRQHLLVRLAGEIEVFPADRRPDPSVKPVVEALYRWFGRLSQFALETTTVSPLAQSVRTVLRKAKDPIEVLFDQLPKACGIRSRAIEDPQVFLETLNGALLELDEAEPKVRRVASASLAGAFGVFTTAAVRALIAADYGPHRDKLTDYAMRQFVDRALGSDLADDKWLDGLAGLLITRRIENWDDTSLDAFSFKVREMADRLARWLFLVRRAAAASMDMASVHIVTTTGQERVVLVRSETIATETTVVENAVREMLTGIPDAHKLLGRLLLERLDSRGEKVEP